MVSDRTPRSRLPRAAGAALGAVMLVACGASALWALQTHFYACAVILVSVSLWSAARAALSAYAGPWRAPLPAAAPAPSDAAELRLMKSLFDQTPAPVVIQRAGGALSAANRSARRLFAVEDRLLDPPAELVAALSHSGLSSRATLRLEGEGGPRAFALSIADLIDERGAIRLAVLVDIQPEIRIAEAAAHREVMQVLSHEIMNALTPITSLAGSAEHLLAVECSEPARQAREAVSVLARRAEGLTRFVDAYRSLARLPEPVLAKTSLGDLLVEAGLVFQGRWSSKGVQFHLIKPEPDIVMALDADLMIHALTNVMSNAAEATLSSGSPEPSVWMSATSVDGGARVLIEDNGPGVCAAETEQIFRPFHTTKLEGSGVGLSFARQVALSHGGSLELLAQVRDKGAAFVFAV